MNHNRMILAALLLAPLTVLHAQMPQELSRQLDRSCRGCHSGAAAKSGLDFGSLKFDLTDRATRERWIRVHDRVEKGEMAPKGIPWSKDDRAKFLQQLTPRLAKADAADVARNGRGAMRRLNRDEYEQNLRDVLQLPLLDIRDMLPEDREAYHFNKVSETLDISHAQLGAYLDAAETALRQAIVSLPQPPAMSKFSAVGTRLFPGLGTAGGSKAMFFIRDNKRVALDTTGKNPVPPGADQDSTLEMGLFRSPPGPMPAIRRDSRRRSQASIGFAFPPAPCCNRRSSR